MTDIERNAETLSLVLGIKETETEKKLKKERRFNWFLSLTVILLLAALATHYF